MQKAIDRIPTVNGIVFNVREDWHETRHYTEDGERIVESIFSVVAEDAIGYRWQSIHSHPSYASAKAESRYWRRTLPSLPIEGMDDHKSFGRADSCYGSAAWSQVDEDNLARFDDERYDDNPRYGLVQRW